MSGMANYYLNELKKDTGCNWVRDYSGNDAGRIFRELELDRKRLARYVAFNRTLTLTWKLGGLAFIAGIALAVWSSLVGLDAGNAAGSLIASGIVGFIAGLIASLTFTVQIVEDYEDRVHRREDAYDSALQQQAGAA